MSPVLVISVRIGMISYSTSEARDTPYLISIVNSRSLASYRWRQPARLLRHHSFPGLLITPFKSTRLPLQSMIIPGIWLHDLMILRTKRFLAWIYPPLFSCNIKERSHLSINARVYNSPVIVAHLNMYTPLPAFPHGFHTRIYRPPI